jgi:hypothetical protein
MAVAGFIVGTALGVALGALTPRRGPHRGEQPAAGAEQAPTTMARSA